MKNEIYYVTGNAGKFEEVQKFFAMHETNIIVKQFDVDIEEIQTLDQKKIAVDKAHKAWNLLKKPLLLDDGGLFFERYNQFPGTMSKFIFHALGFEGIFKLVNEGDKAAFILQMVYIDGNILETFEGRCDGTIVKHVDVATHPQLPLTAIFKPDGSDKTYAELRHTPEFVNFAFRQRALKKFLEWYGEKYSVSV